MQRLLVVALAALALSGCAVSQAHDQHRREVAARRIVDDTLAFNDAYQQAITSQVLLNILRAQNRQPRQYMSMSGFTQHGGSRGASITIGGVALDRLGESWGSGDFSAERSGPVSPDYTLSPFATDAFANIVMRPTDPLLFRYYWDSGWNPDLLLTLIVERVRILPVGGGAPVDLYNAAGTIAEDCTGTHDENGCAFVLAMRRLAIDISRSDRLAAPPAEQGACGAFAVYGAPGAAPVVRPRTTQPRPTQQANPNCPVEIIVGDQRYLMALRSLDDIVYYVGQLMRRDAREPARRDGEMRARLGATAPGFPLWANERTPLFRIVPATHETERTYAATVTFAGHRYSAGAPVDRFCYDEHDVANCRSAEYLDLSGTVLELLVGILAFNQSDEAVAPPQNSVFEVR